MMASTQEQQRDNAEAALRQVIRRLVGDKSPDRDRRLVAYWNNYLFWCRQLPTMPHRAGLDDATTAALVTAIVTGKLRSPDND